MLRTRSIESTRAAYLFIENHMFANSDTKVIWTAMDRGPYLVARKAKSGRWNGPIWNLPIYDRSTYSVTAQSAVYIDITFFYLRTYIPLRSDLSKSDSMSWQSIESGKQSSPKRRHNPVFSQTLDNLLIENIDKWHSIGYCTRGQETQGMRINKVYTTRIGEVSEGY